MNKVKFQNLREFLREELLKILKIFLLIYLALFFFFGAREIIRKIDEKFSYKNPKVIASESQKENVFVEKPDSILIPGISIEAPLILVNSTQPEDFREPLKKGVTHFPSALPGQIGRTIILGHSAPPGWPKINYNWVFSELEKLEGGDEVFIFYNNRQYKYLVREKIFLKKGQDLPPSMSESFPELFLISCWPPGIDNKRLAVRAELSSGY